MLRTAGLVLSHLGDCHGDLSLAAARPVSRPDWPAALQRHGVFLKAPHASSERPGDCSRTGIETWSHAGACVFFDFDEITRGMSRRPVPKGGGCVGADDRLYCRSPPMPCGRKSDIV
eukprot:scaffold429_cov269-Pinguiococcus_pyrenoidosus.AAC.3